MVVIRAGQCAAVGTQLGGRGVSCCGRRIWDGGCSKRYIDRYRTRIAACCSFSSVFGVKFGGSRLRLCVFKHAYVYLRSDRA